MLNTQDILETIQMVREENLDIRTITMGISLYDCVSEDEGRLCDKIYDKITTSAKDLVKTGEAIEKDYGIPIVNKRVSVTPVSLIGGALSPEGYLKIAKTLQRAADTVGINFIGGFSALVQKGMTRGAENMISIIPEALAETECVCSSVNVASTKAGINMDAIRKMGSVIKRAAYLTRDRGSIGCAKLVVFANVPEDNPSIPCISYMELSNASSETGDTLGYSVIQYQIKVWSNKIEDLQNYASQIDNALRPLGWKRVGSNELFDRESTMMQKILVYEAKALETFE